jgi:hypothetical protein
MKLCTIFATLMLTACHHNNYPSPKVLSLYELEHFQKDCKKADAQLADLQYSKEVKRLANDPDMLNAEDRKYNQVLKDTIWWYTYTCGEQS